MKHKKYIRFAGEPRFFTRQKEKTLFWKRFFFGLLVLLLLANFFIRPQHPHFGLEKIPGFWAVFGLGGAILLAVLSKAAAHRLLGRGEDFYDRH